MFKNRLWSLLTPLLFILTASPVSFAIESTEVLPQGIRSLSVQLGTVSGLNQQYTSSGELKLLSDVNSTELNAQTLQRIEPAVNNLVSVLNSFGHHDLGSQINLGRLYVDSDPSVSFFAPIFLYGISERLTMGIAVPIVKYKNAVSVGQTGSNLSQLRAEVGGLIPEIDAAFDQLNRDMRIEFNKFIVAQGYKSLKNVDETFVGDVQIISAYQIPKSGPWTHAAQVFLTLPTGPKADPDDLTDIESFGRWGLRGAWITDYALSRRLSALGIASYQVVAPQSSEKRVPLDGQDPLPNASQKMRLNEDIGDSWSLAAAASLRASAAFTHMFAYSYERKFSDSYSGAPNGRGSFLESHTSREAHLAKYEITYSSVAAYKAQKAMIPGTISYQLSQVVSGVNIENQTRHELWLKMFF